MEPGWRSGESTRLPPMWPGFDSRTRFHMWVEFVVGSCPCSEGFSPGTSVFLHPLHFQIPIRPGNSGEKSHSVDSTETSPFFRPHNSDLQKIPIQLIPLNYRDFRETGLWVIYLLSSHKASVLGTGTPADPNAFITLKRAKKSAV